MSDYDWNIYHDMDDRNYKDVAKIAELEKELKLRHTWVKHHQSCAELDAVKTHTLKDRIETLEAQFITKEK